MNYVAIIVVIVLIILVGIQYSLNKIIILLKEIKDLLYKLRIRN